MAAQESPIRINARLLAQAQAAAETFHRKAPEQISYWADIGRILESRLSASEISALMSGIAEIHVSMPATTPAPDRAKELDIFALAASHQNTADFEKAEAFITQRNTGPRYQASTEHSGLLERIAPDGSITLGTFKNGKFKKSPKHIPEAV